MILLSSQYICIVKTSDFLFFICICFLDQPVYLNDTTECSIEVYATDKHVGMFSWHWKISKCDLAKFHTNRQTFVKGNPPQRSRLLLIRKRKALLLLVVMDFNQKREVKILAANLYKSCLPWLLCALCRPLQPELVSYIQFFTTLNCFLLQQYSTRVCKNM